MMDIAINKVKLLIDVLSKHLELTGELKDKRKDY